MITWEVLLNVPDPIRFVMGPKVYPRTTFTALPGLLSGIQETLTCRSDAPKPTAWVLATVVMASAVAGWPLLLPRTIAYRVASRAAWDNRLVTQTARQNSIKPKITNIKTTRVKPDSTRALPCWRLWRC